MTYTFKSSIVPNLTIEIIANSYEEAYEKFIDCELDFECEQADRFYEEMRMNEC